MAYDNKTRSIGSRLDSTDGNNKPVVVSPGALLCDLVQDSPAFSSADKGFYCQLLNALVEPASKAIASNPKSRPPCRRPSSSAAPRRSPRWPVCSAP